MEGLNGHFCHGFYPQVCPKSHKNTLLNFVVKSRYRAIRNIIGFN